MIDIDSSEGGQVLRTALALSAITGNPITVKNIRQKRPKSGLRPQHLTGLKTIAKICNAKITGDKVGSNTISFVPGKISSVQLTVNVGTAGSLLLLLQSIMPPCLLEKIGLRMIGGTDVPFSPPFDYMKEILLPTIKKMGCNFELDLIKRGYIPKGNGIVSFKSAPAKLPLKPISLTKFSEPERVMIFSHCANLPKEVSVNQAISAKKTLMEKFSDLPFEEHIEFNQPSDTVGSGITLIAVDSKGNKIGASALGAKGKPAFNVGKEAAEKLLKELSFQKPVDSHLADQLIPFMALAEGYSTIECTQLTDHALNNIMVCEKLLDSKFKVKGALGEPAEIFVNGVGFK